MPEIKAFKGIYPRADLASQVVVQLDDFSLKEAKKVRNENSHSFFHLLVPKLVHAYPEESKQEVAYRLIKHNLKCFLEDGVFLQDNSSCLYVYQVSCPGLIQAGVWCITSVDDYLDGRIKKHESTRPEREKKLVEYLEHTGIDTNPVLITYPQNQPIDQIIDSAVEGAPFLQFQANDSHYRLWRIENESTIKELQNLFKGIPWVYIADGHHRAAAAVSHALKKRASKQHSKALDERFNYFSTVYMASNQVKIYQYNRLVKDLNGLSPAMFFEQLQEGFLISESLGNRPVVPSKKRHYGMYINRKWYELSVKTGVLDPQPDVLADLDVSVLQQLILDRILGVKDPRNDQRLDFKGGKHAIDDLVEEVDSGRFSLAFTLFPPSVDELMRVADENQIMPPKSTWFEPKFFLGLLIHQI